MKDRMGDIIDRIIHLDRVSSGYPMTEGVRQSLIKAHMLVQIAKDIVEDNTDGKDPVDYILFWVDVKIREAKLMAGYEDHES